MLLETYLYKDYSKDLFKDITNGPRIHINKPDGGLWTSPVDSENSWKSWCISEGFREDPEYDRHHYIITVNDGSRIFKVETVSDALRLPTLRTVLGEKAVNYERLVELGYDGLWLTSDGVSALRMPEFTCPEVNVVNFYAWDVETVLLFNRECIKEIKKVD